MPQIVLLLKRKPGMTPEEFKAHYESSHAQMAMKHHGHLMKDYRRNYTETQFGLDEFGKPLKEPVYDCVTVITFENDENMAEFMKENPELSAEFIADEHRFLDREKTVGFTAHQEVAPL
ncbi:MAG TPA: EthD domain-containing protein [Novosphingobium sp.]|nr:EthD domain-containing protein [Novosphingobium sp.]